MRVVGATLELEKHRRKFMDQFPAVEPAQVRWQSCACMPLRLHRSTSFQTDTSAGSLVGLARASLAAWWSHRTQMG